VICGEEGYALYRKKLLPSRSLRLTLAATFVWPALAAETTSVPNLSGIWGSLVQFEPPSSDQSGCQQASEARWSIIQSVVGDFTNPS